MKSFRGQWLRRDVDLNHYALRRSAIDNPLLAAHEDQQKNVLKSGGTMQYRERDYK